MRLVAITCQSDLFSDLLLITPIWLSKTGPFARFLLILLNAKLLSETSGLARVQAGKFKGVIRMVGELHPSIE